MKPDDIIPYAKIVAEEGVQLQKGMNYASGSRPSIFLMSIRKGAPYRDEIDAQSGNLIYEGHDAPRRKNGPNPKTIDQPMTYPKGTWTENGKFYRAAVDFKTGLTRDPHLVKVYEKIMSGVWCYKGVFQLVDAKIVHDGARNVFKYYLHPVEKKLLQGVVDVPFTRMIPTQVKLEVWTRDKGCCVLCGEKKNLHFDHDIPYSKGGTSLSANNVRILCAKCNLSKSDKIMAIAPWFAPALLAAGQSYSRMHYS